MNGSNSSQFSTLAERAIRGAFALYKYRRDLLTDRSEDQSEKTASARTAKTIRGIDQWEKKMIRYWKRSRRILVLKEQDGVLVDFILRLRRRRAKKLTARFIVNSFPDAVAEGFTLDEAKSLVGVRID